MQLFISPKSAAAAGQQRLDKAARWFRVYPFVKLHKDGSASHCFRVALFTKYNTFIGWV